MTQTLCFVAAAFFVSGLLAGYFAMKSGFQNFKNAFPVVALLVVLTPACVVLLSGPASIATGMGIYLLFCVGQLIGMLARGFDIFKR